MIVYYYYFGLQITSIGVTPSAWEIFSIASVARVATESNHKIIFISN